MNTEPVLTGTLATSLAALLVAIGQWTGLYHLTPDVAAGLVASVAGLVALVAGAIVRRKVSPVTKPAAPVPPAGAEVFRP